METTEQDPFELPGDMTPAQRKRHEQLVAQEAARKAKRATGRAAITPAGEAALAKELPLGPPSAEAIERELAAEGTEEAGPPNGNGGGYWDRKAAVEEVTGILSRMIESATAGLLARIIAGEERLAAILRKGSAVVPTNDRRYELELAEGVEPIDRLQAARREAVGRLSKLEAKYEVWDARRKNHRQGVMTLIDTELTAQDQEEYAKARKLWQAQLAENPKAKEPTAPKGRSEAELERLAASDPRVVAILDEAEEWLAELFLTRNEVKEYDEIVNRDQAVLRLRARERDL